MSEKLIYITDNDMKRLKELIMVAREFGNESEKYLKELENELERGKVVKSQDKRSESKWRRWVKQVRTCLLTDQAPSNQLFYRQKRIAKIATLLFSAIR